MDGAPYVLSSYSGQKVGGGRSEKRAGLQTGLGQHEGELRIRPAFGQTAGLEGFAEPFSEDELGAGGVGGEIQLSKQECDDFQRSKSGIAGRRRDGAQILQQFAPGLVCNGRVDDDKQIDVAMGVQALARRRAMQIDSLERGAEAFAQEGQGLMGLLRGVDDNHAMMSGRIWS